MKRRLFLKVAVGCTVLGTLALAEGSGMTQEEIQTLLQLHNQARSDFGSAPLTWSEELAAGAQQWAQHLASKGLFQHSNGPYGENLAMASDVDQVFDLWYEERDLYRPGGDFTMDCGHYTQMVWHNTRQMGCGKAETPDGMAIWVARYNPPGNIVGEKP